RYEDPSVRRFRDVPDRGARPHCLDALVVVTKQSPKRADPQHALFREPELGNFQARLREGMNFDLCERVSAQRCRWDSQQSRRFPTPEVSTGSSRQRAPRLRLLELEKVLAVESNQVRPAANEPEEAFPRLGDFIGERRAAFCGAES